MMSRCPLVGGSKVPGEDRLSHGGDRTKAGPRRTCDPAARRTPPATPTAPASPLDHHHRVVGEPPVPGQRGQHVLQLGGLQLVRRIREDEIERPPGCPPPRPSPPAGVSTVAPGSPTTRTFAEITSAAFRSDSTSTTRAAPRDSASSPIAPDPAYRSSTASPWKLPNSDSSDENSASRTRSAVGRVPLPGGTAIRRPPAAPPTIRVTSSPGTRWSRTPARSARTPAAPGTRPAPRPPRRSSWPRAGR